LNLSTRAIARSGGFLLLAAVGLASAAGLAAGPVTWATALAGPARTELEQALTRPFEPYDTRHPKTKEEKTVATCRELLELAPGFAPGPEPDYRAFLGQRVRCQVIELMLSARPPESDFLGPLALDDRLLDELPASLIPTPAPGEARKLDQAARAGASWRKRDPKIRIVRQQPGAITVESPKTRAILTVLGRGDVDGDNLADVVLERAGGGRTGTWATTDAFILTRRTPTGRLVLVSRIPREP
jgi:hypothetical protein